MYEKWQCPECGAPIGYLGRFFQRALHLTPACKKNKPIAVSQPTPSSRIESLMLDLCTEFGWCFSNPKMMGMGGSNIKSQYRIDICKWKLDEDGNPMDDDPPLKLFATAESVEEAAKILKTKLRLLT